MKIGDEVHVHGYVDEIRKDVVIIKNEGGYFGTIPEEILVTDFGKYADTLWEIAYERGKRDALIQMKSKGEQAE